MSGGTPEEALKRTLKFLAFRARSEQEIRVKLTQLGFPHETVEATLSRLRKLNFLNDEQFARDWALARAEGRGYGFLRSERELRDKGVSQSLIQQIVVEIFGQNEGKERAQALLEKRFRDQDLGDPRVLRRAVAFLQRRGYQERVITELLKSPVEGD